MQAGIGKDPAHHAVIPPLYLSSTYEIDGIGDAPPYQYSRTANPTRDVLADALCALECGSYASVTCSGMAAITLMVHLLEPEDLLLAPYDCYGRAYRLLATLAEKKHFRLKFVDPYDLEALASEIAADPPKMIFLETPSNPVMRVADIAAIADMVHAHDGICAVDNTFLSPILQQPLKLGADLVLHSTTKFLNGHSDVVGGAIITNRDDLAEEIAFWANSLGVIGAPFDSFLTLRGIRTLELRVRRAQENATHIAQALKAHPQVSRVYYPGLEEHGGYEVAKAQQEGFGAMLSFELAGGADAAKSFVKALDIFKLAQSLGGTESLINHPASMTHVSMGAEAREKAGVTDGLLRLSVGVEHIDDLMDDLTGALEHLS